jgi:hypothetical protein
MDWWGNATDALFSGTMIMIVEKGVVNRRTFSFERLSLTMNRTTCSFERLSLTPALSRWERENGRLMA